MARAHEFGKPINSRCARSPIQMRNTLKKKRRHKVLRRLRAQIQSMRTGIAHTMSSSVALSNHSGYGVVANNWGWLRSQSIAFSRTRRSDFSVSEIRADSLTHSRLLDFLLWRANMSRLFGEFCCGSWICRQIDRKTKSVRPK